MKKCVFCGTTFEPSRSSQKFCSIRCLDKERYPRKHKKYLERLYSNPEFHKKELDKYKKYNHKRYKENRGRILELNKKSEDLPVSVLGVLPKINVLAS